MENLKVGMERSSEEELKDRFDGLSKEIQELWWPDKSKEKIDIADWALNWQFAEYLLKNKDALMKLKADVDKLKSGDWKKLWSKAWKGLDDLATFLDDISNTDRMEKDYNEFMEKIQKPKKLSTLKSWEVRRLNLYLWMNEDKALTSYKAMKPIFWKYNENWMKPEDVAFFESIWETIKTNYSKSDKFVEADYPFVSKLQPTVSSLKSLAGENWDGKNESINIPDVENSIVDKSKVKEKVDWINNERIESNREKVKNIKISIDDAELSKFTKSDWKLKYGENKSDFDVETMMQEFGDQIQEAAKNETEFVSDDERNAMIDECKWEIFNKLMNQLLWNSSIKEEQKDKNSEGGEVSSDEVYVEKKDNFKIKLKGLDEEIQKLWFYDAKIEWDDVKFNIVSVKKYLDEIKDKSWKDLEIDVSPIERWKWTIAVQIALNYLAKRDGKSDYNVHYVDWIRGDETLKWVKSFQKENGLKFKNGQPDWLPGSVTIKKILAVLWWSDVSWNDDKNKKSVDEENKDNKPVDEENKDNKPVDEENKDKQSVDEENKDKQSVDEEHKDKQSVDEENKDNKPVDEENKDNKSVDEENKKTGVEDLPIDDKIQYIA